MFAHILAFNYLDIQLPYSVSRRANYNIITFLK